MILGTGTFDGRNGYQLKGTFTIVRRASGEVHFETSEDFFFGNAMGQGTPAPGFALFNGDPTGLTKDVVEPTALATDFLRIANTDDAVSGKQSGVLSGAISMGDFDTVFLWCFKFPTVLGVGAIVPEEPNGL